MTVLHLRESCYPTRSSAMWLVDGRLNFDRYAGAAETISDRGIRAPRDSSTRTAASASAPEGHVPDPAGQAQQATRDRDAGALLLRDADRRWTTPACSGATICPRLIRAGRHIARPYRYIRDLGVEVEPDDLVAEIERRSRARRRLGKAGRRLDRPVYR
mgnify:CR=1 FL=1